MKLLALFCTLVALVASNVSYHGHKVGEERPGLRLDNSLLRS